MWKMKFPLKFIASNEICFVALPVDVPAEFCHDMLKSSPSILIFCLALEESDLFDEAL